MKHSRIVIPSYDSVPTPLPFKPLRRKENLFFIGLLLFCFLLVWEMRPGPPVLSACSATELSPFLSKIWVAVCHYSCKSYHMCKIHVAVIIHRNFQLLPWYSTAVCFQILLCSFLPPTHLDAQYKMDGPSVPAVCPVSHHTEYTAAACGALQDYWRFRSTDFPLTACRESLEQWVPRSLKEPETHPTARSSHLELVRFVLSAWAHFGFKL